MITLDESDREFRPGDSISGKISWNENESAEMEARLIWYTEGKGDRDVEVVDSQPIAAGSAQNSTRFEFTAPHRPFSFSGKLISLIWAIEVVMFPSRNGQQETITISNLGTEIILDKSFEDGELIQPVVRVG